MRKSRGALSVTVYVSKREVEDFASRWPCFGTRRALRFSFDASNGDLVGLAGDKGMDSDGVRALAQDAWNYAKS